MTQNKKTIGLVETIVIRGASGERKVLAKIDTGASRTTIDTELAAKVGLGPILNVVKVKAPISQRSEVRPLVQAKLIIAGETFELPVGITDRKDMKYPVIIGMDILKEGRFVIDMTKVPINETANA